LVAGQLSVTLKKNLFTIDGGYRFVDTPSTQVDGIIGTRIFSFDTSLSTSGGLLVPRVSDSRSAAWADLIIAGRVILPFDDGTAPWFASLYGDIGGGPNGDLTLQLFGGVGYNFNKTMAGFVGYRYLAINHSSGRFDYRFQIPPARSPAALSISHRAVSMNRMGF
jgi:hypothetical protein